MSTQNSPRIDGVAGIKKYDVPPIRVAFMLYCLVAAGAFGIEEMIPMSGPGLSIVMLIVFPIIWALPICLTVSELSAYMPAEGGVYVWTKDALGEFWGFVMGWWTVISIYLATAVYVVLIVGYAGKYIPMSETQAYALKVAIILIFTIINLLGIKEVSWVSTMFAVLILIAFAFVAVVGFVNWNHNPFEPFTPEGQTAKDSIGASICIVIWMYCGYECISNMAGEIKNPKSIPKGFMIAMPLIAVSYILPTLAGLASVGQWDSWATEGEGAVGYSDVLSQNLGPVWGAAFLVIAILSQCAIFNAYLAAGPREFFVMADDRLSPHFLVRVSQKRGVPYISIILLSVVTFIMMHFDFSTILLITVPIAILIYILLPIVFIKFRKKYPVETRGDVYYIKGKKPLVYGIVLTPLFIGVIALVVNGTEYFLLGFISILSALVFYLIFKWGCGGLHKVDPIKYPLNEKTKLAPGDVWRIGVFLFLTGALAVFGRFFLEWYEGEWGAEYYLDTYGSGLISNFPLMLDTSLYGGIAALICGAVLYLIGRKVDR